MSLLPALTPMAAILLGLSIAYLRLEQFQHLKRIRARASENLKKLAQDGNEVPKTFRESDYYRKLACLAGKTQDPEVQILTGFSGKLYSALFNSQKDRKISVFMAWVSLVLVILGAAHDTGQLQWSTFLFGAEWIAWTLWPLALLNVLSVVLVLAGDRYVSCTYREIDTAAKQLEIFLRGGASEAVITDTDDGSVENIERLLGHRPSSRSGN